MDVATILMIATCKYVSFAFCYSDGFKEKKDLFLGFKMGNYYYYYYYYCRLE